MQRFLLVALLAGPISASAQSLVVVHKDQSTVGVYSVADGSAAAVLPTGDGPHEVAVSGDGRWAVVTDYGAGVGGQTLTVVDLESNTVARVIELPFVRPHGAQFMVDNRTVAVTAERDGKVVMVDVVGGVVVGELDTRQAASHMVALSPDNNTAYTANISPGTLSMISVGGGEATVVQVGSQTEAIAAAPDGKTVWLGSNNTGKVFVVDVGLGRVIDSVQTAGFPYRIAFTPDAAIAIVTNPDADEVRLIDVYSREVLHVVSTPGTNGPGRPFGVIVDSDGSRFWVTLRGTGEVVEIDLASAAVTNRFSTGPGSGPDGIGFAR